MNVWNTQIKDDLWSLGDPVRVERCLGSNIFALDLKENFSWARDVTQLLSTRLTWELSTVLSSIFRAPPGTQNPKKLIRTVHSTDTETPVLQ